MFFAHATKEREEDLRKKKNNYLNKTIEIDRLIFRDFILQMADSIGRRKENIVDLNKYLDKRIRVKFNGGRECSGVLKGNFPRRSARENHRFI